MKRSLVSPTATLVFLTACGGSGATTTTSAGSGGSTASSTTSASITSSVTASTTTGSSTSSTSSSSIASSSSASSSSGGPPTAADLLAVLGTCNQVSTGKYKTDADSASATVAICGLNGAFYWQADMDVDCDGQVTTQCSTTTDHDFQAETSATDSKGGFLDAANLPYVVIPLPSSRFNYMTEGLELGDVVAVIYNGQLNYGVFGDEGPSDIIGEASYAMAKSLGIDPDPSTGGTDSGVTYIAFPGSAAVVKPIEDHAAAMTLGQKLAAELIAKN